MTTASDLNFSTDEKDFDKGRVFEIGNWHDSSEMCIENGWGEDCHEVIQSYGIDSGEQLAVVWTD